MKEEVILIGIGGHGRVVLDAILSNSETNIKIIGFLDDGDTKEVYGLKKLGNICDWKKYRNKKFHIAVGNNNFRKELSEKVGRDKLVTIIHKTAYISQSVQIGVGSYIGAMVVINSESIIGKSCIINTGSIIEHNCEIGDYSHLSYRVLVGSESKISTESMLDMGKILERKSKI